MIDRGHGGAEGRHQHVPQTRSRRFGHVLNLNGLARIQTDPRRSPLTARASIEAHGGGTPRSRWLLANRSRSDHPGQVTKRPQNKCLDCGDTWYPRGRDVSKSCPNCQGRSVEVVDASGAMVLAVVLALCLAVFVAANMSPNPPPAPALEASADVASPPPAMERMPKVVVRSRAFEFDREGAMIVRGEIANEGNAVATKVRAFVAFRLESRPQAEERLALSADRIEPGKAMGYEAKLKPDLACLAKSFEVRTVLEGRPQKPTVEAQRGRSPAPSKARPQTPMVEAQRHRRSQETSKDSARLKYLMTTNGMSKAQALRVLRLENSARADRHRPKPGPPPARTSPETAEGGSVYYLENSHRHHALGCRYLSGKSAYSSSLAAASSRGLTPCKACGGGGS